jgi:hypothetical protein
VLIVESSYSLKISPETNPRENSIGFRVTLFARIPVAHISHFSVYWEIEAESTLFDPYGFCIKELQATVYPGRREKSPFDDSLY